MLETWPALDEYLDNQIQQLIEKEKLELKQLENQLTLLL